MKEDNIHDVPGKGGELARHFGNAVEVDVDKGYLEEWNAPGLSKERNVKLHRKRYYRNGKFTCDECGIPAKREVMNQWHMQSAHVLGRIVCDRCGGPVRKGRNVKSHMKTNHRNGKFTCHECGIPAKREVMNEWHMQS